ncbi:MAG TPA: hypothetical protein VFC86_04310 [Planctomycetota bacterium]|nr:hypothetical protein [Planctomycetota bacterium]
MVHKLAAGLLAVWALTGAAFQDAPPAAAPPKADEAKDLLKKGLETSAAAGGFTFTGSVDQESPFGGAGMAMGGPMLSVGPQGKCTGTLGTDGVAHVRIEKDKNIYELYRKGSKVVHRQVWKGSQAASGSFASEAGAALDLARLAKAAAKSKDVKQEAETKKVGDVDCVAIKTGLSADLVEAEEAPAGAAGFEFKMFELKKIEATFYFGKDDHLLRKAEFKFVKGFNAMIAGAIPGGGGGDDDDDDEDGGGGMVKTSFATTFKFTLGAFSKTAAVAAPDDVKELLKD